jgi:6-pyruvoyltetrahydropterin/6-carboxytetrahydropterin synthase
MTIIKEFHFEASHVVPDHPGKCRRLHGHSYKLQVALYGEVDPATGFLVDFADLKAAVLPLIDTLDHRHMNFFIENPTAENIAAWFGQRLSRMVDGFIIMAVVVTVKETANSVAIWDSRLAGDRSQGQNPSKFRTGVPLVQDTETATAKIGPVQISLTEHEQYMAVLKLAYRETANRINAIRGANQTRIPSHTELGAVKETH